MADPSVPPSPIERWLQCSWCGGFATDQDSEGDPCGQSYYYDGPNPCDGVFEWKHDEFAEKEQSHG